MIKTKEYVVQAKETGDIIDHFDTIEEAKKCIELFKKEDESLEDFDPEFYEIAKWDEKDEYYAPV